MCARAWSRLVLQTVPSDSAHHRLSHQAKRATPLLCALVSDAAKQKPEAALQCVRVLLQAKADVNLQVDVSLVTCGAY